MNLESYLKNLTPLEKEKVALVSHSMAGNPIAVIIRKNGDFTEGRGPMMFHKVCDDYATARDYISVREGIHGSSQDRSGVFTAQDSIIESWNGYEIVLCPVTTRDMVPTIDEVAKMKPLIDKLSGEFPELWYVAMKVSNNDKAVAVDRLKKALKIVGNG